MAVIELNSNNWQDKVLSAKAPVVVDFWAPWCPWCMKLMPVFEGVSEQYYGKLIFAKVNVEENQDIAQANGVMGIPDFPWICSEDLYKKLKKEYPL